MKENNKEAESITETNGQVNPHTMDEPSIVPDDHTDHALSNEANTPIEVDEQDHTLIVEENEIDVTDEGEQFGSDRPAQLDECRPQQIKLIKK